MLKTIKLTPCLNRYSIAEERAPKMHKDDPWQLVKTIFIVAIAVFSYISYEIATSLGADFGVTAMATLYTVIVAFVIFFLLRNYFNTKPIYYPAVMAAFIFPGWWKVIGNVAGKLQEPVWWNTNWFKYGLEAFFVLWVLFLLFENNDR